MSLRHIFARYVFSGLLAVALSSTAVAADRKTTNTLLGAGVGAAAGAVLSEGDPMVTLGSAAAGGVLGHVLTEDRKHRSYSTHRHYKDNKRYYNNGHRKAKRHSQHKKRYSAKHRRGNKHHYAPGHRQVSKRYGHGNRKHRHQYVRHR